MILMDASSIFISSVMVQIDELASNPDQIRHTIFNVIRKYNLEHRDEFGELIICFDSKNVWRKNVYPHYKHKRQKNRDKDEYDWNAIFSIIDTTKKELIEYSPYRCIEVDGAEADDVIGAICEKHNSPEPILIISPDQDFIQLQRYPNVKQYSNTQKKWVEPIEDPVTDLANKIISGDKGDGVPNCLSDDLTLVEERRQTTVSAKKRALLLEDPQALGTQVSRQWIRNKELIDLTRIPDDIKNRVIESLEKRPNGNITRLMSLFVKNQMKLMIESLSDFEVRVLNK